MAHNHNHNHSHGHSHGHHHHGEANISFAFWLNTAFAIIELVGGYLTNSVAIMSDALHDFGDSFSLGISWYFQRVSKKKRDEKYSYGYKRFSLLGAFINSIVLTVGSVIIIEESVRRVLSPVQPNADGMIWLSVLGIAANGLAMLRLKKGKSINERVVYLHFIEDVLGWVAVLIGAIVMKFFTVPVLDPILSIAIAAYILLNVYRNIKESLKIVLQAMPESVSEEKIKEALAKYPEVLSVHDIHIWTMDGEYNVLSMHIVVSPEKAIGDLESLKAKIKHAMEHMDISHTTLEMETDQAHCEQVDC
jgi:cobalt-zinc-cadmium efflux system protein